jgi:O-antigen/teichoic acid export membrane protein
LNALGAGSSQPSIENGSVDARSIARSASTVALPVIGGMGLSFILSIVLARWLGAAEYGTYTYVVSWVTVLGMASVLGLDTALVRQAPAYITNTAWDLLGGLLRWANGLALLVSVGLVGLVFLAHSLLVGGGPAVPSIWLVAGLLLPVVALARVQQSTLRGLHHPATSQVPELVLGPGLMLALVAVTIWTGAATATAENAVIAQTVAASLGLTVAVWLVYRAIPDPARVAKRRYLYRQWLGTSGRMFLMTSLTTLNGRIGILLLGVIATPQVVGPFSVALRGASFISLPLSVTVLAMAASMARAFAAGHRARLELLSSRMSRIALLGGIPVAVVLLVWGGSFLELFGTGFVGARIALTILIAGELVNVAAGPVATLLVMMGHERDAVVGLAIGTALNAGLCLILIPRWGINGAAVAAAAGVAVWNVVLWRSARRRLTMMPDA